MPTTSFDEKEIHRLNTKFNRSCLRQLRIICSSDSPDSIVSITQFINSHYTHLLIKVCDFLSEVGFSSNDLFECFWILTNFAASNTCCELIVRRGVVESALRILYTESDHEELHKQIVWMLGNLGVQGHHERIIAESFYRSRRHDLFHYCRTIKVDTFTTKLCYWMMQSIFFHNFPVSCRFLHLLNEKEIILFVDEFSNHLISSHDVEVRLSILYIFCMILRETERYPFLMQGRFFSIQKIWPPSVINSPIEQPLIVQCSRLLLLMNGYSNSIQDNHILKEHSKQLLLYPSSRKHIFYMFYMCSLQSSYLCSLIQRQHVHIQKTIESMKNELFNLSEIACICMKGEWKKPLLTTEAELMRMIICLMVEKPIDPLLTSFYAFSCRGMEFLHVCLLEIHSSSQWEFISYILMGVENTILLLSKDKIPPLWLETLIDLRTRTDKMPSFITRAIHKTTHQLFIQTEMFSL